MSESIGQILLQARNARSLSTAEAAARLRCDEAVLLALEAERFDELGAPVFVQGHLRRYADFIGAPVDLIMASWAELRSSRLADPDLSRAPRVQSVGVDSQAWGRRMTVVGVALAIALAAWWVLSAGAPVSSEPEIVEPIAIEPVVAAESGVELAAAESAVVESAVVEPRVTEVVAEIVAETSTAAPTTAVAASSATSLVLAPRVASWVELYDATGKRWYWGLASADVPLRFRVQTPIRLVLGRADAVDIEWNGRALSLPAALIFNSTASVNIDARGSVTRYERSSPSTD